MLAEDGFDFAKFNAKATKFDLKVKPSQMFNGSIRAVAGQITCSVETSLWLCAERMRQKTLGSQFRTVEITASQFLPTQVQFTSDSNGNRLKMLIEYISLCARERVTNSRGIACFLMN